MSCVAAGKATQRAELTVTGARVGAKPVLTFTLIGINVLIFLITAVQAKSGTDMTESTVFRDGALSPVVVASGQYWRLVASGFLHASVIHIGLNMVSLYVLGKSLESLLGASRFLAVYLTALLGGSAAIMLFSEPASVSIGASGAIFGLLGGLLVVYKRFKLDMRQLMIVLAINLFISFRIAGISWQAHIGGLLIGAAVTAAMVYSSAAQRKKVQIGSVVAVIVLVAAIVLIKDAQLGAEYCGIDQDQYFISCQG